MASVSVLLVLFLCGFSIATNQGNNGNSYRRTYYYGMQPGVSQQIRVPGRNYRTYRYRIPSSVKVSEPASENAVPMKSVPYGRSYQQSWNIMSPYRVKSSSITANETGPANSFLEKFLNLMKTNMNKTYNLVPMTTNTCGWDTCGSKAVTKLVEASLEDRVGSYNLQLVNQRQESFNTKCSSSSCETDHKVSATFKIGESDCDFEDKCDCKIPESSEMIGCTASGKYHEDDDVISELDLSCDDDEVEEILDE